MRGNNWQVTVTQLWVKNPVRKIDSGFGNGAQTSSEKCFVISIEDRIKTIVIKKSLTEALPLLFFKKTRVKTQEEMTCL